MEQISGYARILVRARAQQEATKPIFGKPTLKYGQCYVMSGYFMQLGAVLAAKYRNKLAAFGHAFLGATGDPDAMQRFVDLAASDVLALVSKGMTFSGYVIAEQINRLNYQGDSARFLFEMGMKKLDLVTGTSMLWQFAEQGAILGAAHPEIAHALFEQTHAPRDQTEWDRARIAGLDIPEEQDSITWEDVEEGESERFMDYCQQCAPSLHVVLIA
jgi:hypothetical protein